MIKSLTFNQLLTYEGERFAQSFNITIERMLFFRWCQILVPKFWIGFQYWANVWNDSTICLWKTQQEVLDSPVLECRNWRSERPLWYWSPNHKIPCSASGELNQLYPQRFHPHTYLIISTDRGKQSLSLSKRFLSSFEFRCIVMVTEDGWAGIPDDRFLRGWWACKKVRFDLLEVKHLNKTSVSAPQKLPIKQSTLIEG